VAAEGHQDGDQVAAEGHQDGDQVAAEGHQDGDQVAAEGHQGGRRGPPPIMKNKPLNRPKKNRAAAAVDFDLFWCAYPSRHPHANPKHPARIAFNQAIQRGHNAALILEQAIEFARHVETEGTDPRFIPQAVTWLKQQRYRDDARFNAKEPPQIRGAAMLPSPQHDLGAAGDWLLRKHGQADFDKWFAKVRVEHSDAESVRLSTPSKLIASRLRTWFKDDVAAAWNVVSVEMTVRS